MAGGGGESFAMSGCGWLTPFHMGVAKELQASGIVTTDRRDVFAAGTSGGALGALVMVSGVRPEDALEALIDFGEKPHLHNDIEANMRHVIRPLLEGSDGLGTEALRHINGRLVVCVTRLWPQTSVRPVLVKEFRDLPYLIDMVGASCFIPFWSAPRFFTSVHSQSGVLGRQHLVDGGFLAFMPPVGNTRVSPFPRQFILRKASQPDICLPVDAYLFPRLLAWALRPAPRQVLRDLFEHGRLATRKWIATNRNKKE